MTFQEQNVRGISILSLKNLSTIILHWPPCLSPLFKTPSECVPIKDIDPMDDGTHTHVHADDPYQQLIDNKNLDFYGNNTSAMTILSDRLIQVAEQLAHSCVTISSKEYLSMSMIIVPEVLSLASLSTSILKEVNLASMTWSFNTSHSFPGKSHFHRKKVIYILHEDIGILTRFSITPLDNDRLYNDCIGVN